MTPTQPPDPFEAHPDWHNNACIDNYMQFGELAQCFLESADALLMCAVNEPRTLDGHVYAICFLYRHSCELLLKDLAWKSNYAATGDKGFAKTHRLGHLWNDVYARTKSLCGSDFPLNAEETEAVKALIANVEEHDPSSDSFRYPFSSKLQRTHPTLRHVNVRALHETTHQLLDYLSRLYTPVDYFYEERSAYEAENHLPKNARFAPDD